MSYLESLVEALGSLDSNEVRIETGTRKEPLLLRGGRGALLLMLITRWDAGDYHGPTDDELAPKAATPAKVTRKRAA